jgi:alcohol dehydrogenase class IV
MSEQQDLQSNWNYPNPVRFGPGRLSELPTACRDLGIERPLLVTDPMLAALPIVQQALDHCSGHGVPCALFTELRANPTETNVTGGVEAFRAGQHDGVIAFGGGSALDTGKAIALMVGQTRSIFDFEDREDWWTRANADGIAPIIAVPTTAGTGSETGGGAVITDESDHTKRIIFHPRMMPGRVISDPVVTAGLPRHLTAATGMDALSHNLEALCSPVYHPMAAGIATEGIRLVHDWLPTACDEGENIEARAHMLSASSMGSTAFQKGLGAMHAMSHPCGALFDTQHGLTNAVVMPYVLEFNREAIETRMERLARYLDLPAPSFEAVLDWVLELRLQLDIPHTLADLGVTEDAVERLAEMGEIDPSAATNPIPLNRDNLTRLFRDALRGRLSRTGQRGGAQTTGAIR